VKLFKRRTKTTKAYGNDDLSVEAVDARFREANAAKRAEGCPCGGPAEVCTSYPTAGTVRSESWSCYRHADVDGWSRTGDQPAIPMYSSSVVCQAAQATAWEERCLGCWLASQEPGKYRSWMCRTHPSDRLFYGRTTA
jgi:hypothetical protein